MEQALFCLIPILGIVFFVIWIIALVDVIKTRFRTENEKIMWILIIVLTGIIGAILYFILSEGKRSPE